MDSILTSIKKLLGIPEEYEHFDPDIIMHINSVFMTLTQLGVGPSEGFYINDEETIWTDFIPDLVKLQAVKTYVYLKVRLVFDPSSIGSSTLAAYERQIQELEWRQNMAAENEADAVTNNGTMSGVVSTGVRLNVRAKPSSTASVLHVLEAGTKVTIDLKQSTGDWYYIYTNKGLWGYCLKELITVS